MHLLNIIIHLTECFEVIQNVRILIIFVYFAFGSSGASTLKGGTGNETSVNEVSSLGILNLDSIDERSSLGLLNIDSMQGKSSKHVDYGWVETCAWLDR